MALRNTRWILFVLLTLGATLARADDVSDLVDVPARDWRSSHEQPKLDRMQKHSGAEPLRLTVHYTDIAKNFSRPLSQKLRILFNFAVNVVEGTKKKLWGDIPYHYFIDANGKLGEARDPRYMPDSNTSYKRDGHITVVVEGNEKDGLTPAQKKKLYALLKALQEKYRIPTGRVATHKDFAQTDCPGVAISAAVKEYMKTAGDK